MLTGDHNNEPLNIGDYVFHIVFEMHGQICDFETRYIVVNLIDKSDDKTVRWYYHNVVKTSYEEIIEYKLSI